MKKRAFTLAEILISLGIIGVIAALSFPAISSMKPNKNKLMYLKTHDSLAQNIKELAANSRLYAACYQSLNVSCEYEPLLNLEASQSEKYKNYSGDKKFCSLMGLLLGVEPEDLKCSDTTYTFNANDYTEKFTSPSFESQNGFRWRIVPQVKTVAALNNSTFQYDIYVDIDPSNNNVSGKDKSCIYDKNKCKAPDIFKFLVAANGHLVPADPMGIYYLSTRQSVTTNKKELENVQFIDSLEEYEKTFATSKCYEEMSE